MSEDREIVAAALARRPGAFEELVRRHEKLVWHMVLRMVPRRDEAEELSQEVFLKVFQQLQRFRFESALSTWIGRIAFSVASRHLRRRRLALVEPASTDAEGTLDPLAQIADGLDLQHAFEQADDSARLAAAIERLPALQKAVVTLYHLDEIPIAEISAITDMPEGTIKSHLFRARHALRQQLQ